MSTDGEVLYQHQPNWWTVLPCHGCHSRCAWPWCYGRISDFTSIQALTPRAPLRATVKTTTGRNAGWFNDRRPLRGERTEAQRYAIARVVGTFRCSVAACSPGLPGPTYSVFTADETVPWAPGRRRVRSAAMLEKGFVARPSRYRPSYPLHLEQQAPDLLHLITAAGERKPWGLPGACKALRGAVAVTVACSAGTMMPGAWRRKRGPRMTGVMHGLLVFSPRRSIAIRHLSVRITFVVWAGIR